MTDHQSRSDTLSKNESVMETKLVDIVENLDDNSFCQDNKNSTEKITTDISGNNTLPIPGRDREAIPKRVHVHTCEHGHVINHNTNSDDLDDFDALDSDDIDLAEALYISCHEAAMKSLVKHLTTNDNTGNDDSDASDDDCNDDDNEDDDNDDNDDDDDNDDNDDDDA